MTTRELLLNQKGTSWAGMLEPPVRMIPPLDPDFLKEIYGSPDALVRARFWALQNQYVLVDGPPPCAHGLYLMRCPLMHCESAGFDHTTIWMPAAEPYHPFLLTQPYHEQPEALTDYAEHHGLQLESCPSDGWYGYRSTPYRLSPPSGIWTAWALGTRLQVMLSAYPFSWPDDLSEWAPEPECAS